MKEWWAGRALREAPAREPAPAVVGERLGEVAGEIWGLALRVANERLASEREAFDAARVQAEQEKVEAVELAKTSGMSQRQVERELGLSSGQIGHWMRELAEQGEAAFQEAGDGAAKVRIRELERRVAALEEEREILKKAVAIFSQPKG